jgi:hypothetical protein
VSIAHVHGNHENNDVLIGINIKLFVEGFNFIAFPFLLASAEELLKQVRRRFLINSRAASLDRRRRLGWVLVPSVHGDIQIPKARLAIDKTYHLAASKY